MSNCTFAPKSSPIGSLCDNTSNGSQISSPASSTSSFFAATSSPAFGTSPAFERNTTEFGQKQKPGLASAATPTSSFGGSFGTPRTQEFGFSLCCGKSASCPFRAQSSPSKFVQSGATSSISRSSPSFGKSASSSFGSQSFPFGQSFSDSSTSRSSPSFRKSAASPFGAQSFPYKFGQSNLGGSRVVPYARTTEWDPISHEPVMFRSISAMKAYKDRSHEELRWEDYCRGDKTQTARDAGFSSNDLGNNRQSDMRRKEKLERDQKTNERMAKAIHEKSSREALAQKNRLAETLDIEIKIWVSGKEGNLRALLSTLHYILGSDSGWKPISLTDRSTSDEVKKAYRQATLHVHPDKLQQRGASSRQKYICERVFQLLQVAWSKFNR